MVEKDYKAIAKIIRDTRKAMDSRCKWFHAINTIEHKLVIYFERNRPDNPLFDRREFRADCNNA